MAFLENMKKTAGTIFGPGTDAPSYEALKRKREIADALMQRSMGQQPKNWGEGVGSLANALAYRIIDRRLAPQEQRAQADAEQQYLSLRQGIGDQGITPEQWSGMQGVADNPYASPAIQSIAKTLMRRQMTPSEAGGFSGGGLGELAGISSKGPMMFAQAMPPADGYPDSGGNFGWTDPGEIPPEEGGREPMEEPPVIPPPDNRQSMMLEGPMSGAGGQIDRYSPKGTQVAGDIKLTEGQSKDLGFWNRMDGSNSEIDQYAGELTSGGERLKGSIPMVGNALVSEGFQRGRRAADEWLWGLLRKDTGAAITEQEHNLYGPTYIPQFGDKPGTLKDKAEARQRAMDGIKKGLGIAEILAEELAAQRKQAQPEAVDGDWRTQDPSTWTDEQLKEYVGG